MSPNMLYGLFFFVLAVGLKNLYEIIDLIRAGDRDSVGRFFKILVLVSAIRIIIDYIKVYPYLG